MRRRAVLGLLAGAPAGWTSRPRAQNPGAEQSGPPVVGFLTPRSEAEAAGNKAAFERGLRRAGFVPGRSVRVEYRWADGRADRLAGFVAELAAVPASLLVAGGDAAALAAASGGLPLAFLMGGDPVQLGLVGSLNRPGGTATGVTLLADALGAKRLETLCEIVPGARTIALLLNARSPSAPFHREQVEAAAAALGRRLITVSVQEREEFGPAFDRIQEAGAGAVSVQNDPFFDSQRSALVGEAERVRLPAMFHIREYPELGGLASYGPSLSGMYEQLGSVVGQLLKGVHPSEVPVSRPTIFELVLNLRTARALGLSIAPTLLARADDVIE